MLYKINALGIVEARSMAEFSCDRCQPVSKSYQFRILLGLRQGNYDFVYDKYWLDKIIELMRPSEILLIHQIDDYYKVSLTTYVEMTEYYKRWCGVNNLIPKKSKNLSRFVKEIRCIWD